MCTAYVRSIQDNSPAVVLTIGTAVVGAGVRVTAGAAPVDPVFVHPPTSKNPSVRITQSPRFRHSMFFHVLLIDIILTDLFPQWGTPGAR